MAESFLFSIAGSLIKRLSTRAYEEAFRALNLNEDLGQLKDTLSIVKGVLLDAEVKQDLKHGLREWLRQIKDVFAEAQDVLDELECHEKEKRVLQIYGSIMEKVCRFLSFSPLAFRFRMAREIKEIRERLDKVAADGAKFDLVRIEDDRGVVHRREMTYSHMIPSDVIGRDKDKEKIINLLIQTHPGGDASMGLSVVSIVGIGGMGKTTLAKFVFNDERIDREFPLKMWVCVSEDFDIKQLMIKIINCVPVALGGQENTTDLDEEQLQNHLKNKLAHKKFFLVLDEVWNKDRVKWVELQNLLQVGVGDRIIVTTRDRKIAEMMGTIPFYELHGLSDEESFTVFIKWAFREGEEKNHLNLVKIGKEIVRKCKGVPLAVRTLASSLFLKFNEEEWESVRRNGIWDVVPQNENEILPALKLSYDRMPFYLRQCFSFFSLYPKDFEFDSIDVTELWMAFGLLQPSNESSELEDVATQYLHELHSRCFLQDFIHFGYFYSFKMHDLVHDLAAFVTKEEFLMVNSHSRVIHEKCRHLSIVENDSGQGKINKSQLLSTNDRKSTKLRKTYYVKENSHVVDCFPKSKCVKSIIFPVEGVELGMNSQDFLKQCLSRYKYLWVLDLSDSSFKTLSKSIGKLRCLRHLNLSFNVYLKKLPNSICELQSLQTLLFKRCNSLQALPKGLRKLISLRQLAVATMQSDFETDISSLTSLQILSFDSCWHLKSLLGGRQLLTSLRELAINGCGTLNSFNFDSIKHLPELVALSIANCPKLELSDGHDNLETTRMKLKFVRFEGLPKLVSLPEWLQGAAGTLHTLIIERCWNLEVLPDWLSTFSHLNTLRIVYCERLSSLPNNMKGFTALECLEIVECPKLERKNRYEVGEYWPNILHSRLKSITIKADDRMIVRSRLYRRRLSSHGTSLCLPRRGT